MTELNPKQKIQAELLESLQSRLIVGMENGYTNRDMARILKTSEQTIGKLISQGSNYSMAIKRINELLPLSGEFYKKPLSQ